MKVVFASVLVFTSLSLLAVEGKNCLEQGKVQSVGEDFRFQRVVSAYQAGRDHDGQVNQLNFKPDTDVEVYSYEYDGFIYADVFRVEDCSVYQLELNTGILCQ